MDGHTNAAEDRTNLRTRCCEPNGHTIAEQMTLFTTNLEGSFSYSACAQTTDTDLEFDLYYEVRRCYRQPRPQPAL